jgi:hypothetical protein
VTETVPRVSRTPVDRENRGRASVSTHRSTPRSAFQREKLA